MDSAFSLAVLALFLATIKTFPQQSKPREKGYLVLSSRLQSFMGRGGSNLKQLVTATVKSTKSKCILVNAQSTFSALLYS